MKQYAKNPRKINDEQLEKLKKIGDKANGRKGITKGIWLTAKASIRHMKTPLSAKGRRGKVVVCSLQL